MADVGWSVVLSRGWDWKVVKIVIVPLLCSMCRMAFG